MNSPEFYRKEATKSEEYEGSVKPGKNTSGYAIEK